MSFSSDNAKWTKDFIQGSQKAIKESAIELCTNIINDSPIEGGAFVNAWGIGTSNFEPGATTSKFTKINEIKQDILRSSVTSVTNDEEIVFINEAPYGERLEFGYSDQAPRGFLRINTLEWNQIVDGNAKKELK